MAPNGAKLVPIGHLGRLFCSFVFRFDRLQSWDHFEHIYRHHRRYRITEGAEEIQMRRVAGYLFGFMGQRAPKGVVED